MLKRNIEAGKPRAKGTEVGKLGFIDTDAFRSGVGGGQYLSHPDREKPKAGLAYAGRGRCHVHECRNLDDSHARTGRSRA